MLTGERNNAPNWQRAAGRMRADLDRADLGARAQRLAEFVVKVTLEAGRNRVVVPQAGSLARLLGLGANHVGGVVKELECARIATFRAMADGWEILAFPDSSTWAVDWVYGRDELAAYLAEVNRAPGQCQGELIEPDPCLVRARSEASACEAGMQAGGPAGQHVGKPDFPFREVESSHFGKSVELALPETGSAVPLSVQRLNAQEAPSKRLNVERLTVQAEARLMKRIEGFVGPGDMVNWGGDWRANWVRKIPHAVAKAVTILEAESKEGWKPNKSRAQALKDLARRLPNTT